MDNVQLAQQLADEALALIKRLAAGRGAAKEAGNYASALALHALQDRAIARWHRRLYGQAEFERQIGRNLYRRGKPIEACATADMTAGYMAEEARGEDAYWRCMMREAN